MGSVVERSRALRVLRGLALIALFGCVGGICGPGPQPPPSDVCDKPSTGKVSRVELGTPRLDPFRSGTTPLDDRPPRMLADSDPLWVVTGGQGSPMVMGRLVLRGSDVPDCIAQDTQVLVDGKLAARNRDNLATYPLEPGVRATKTFYLPGVFGAEATVTTDAAGQKASVTVRPTATESCAERGACPCVRALDCCPNEALSDAGRALWEALQACRGSCDAGSACGQDGGPCDSEKRACEADTY